MLKKICLIVLSVALLLLPLSALADAGYSIESYAMYVSVQPDGSAAVVEQLEYDFDGEYNGILSLFDADGVDGIEDFRVTIDGVEMTPVDEMTYISNTYTVTETAENLFEVRIYSPGSGDRRTVLYEYTLTGLARRYADTGMIHRKFIGENSAVTLQNASVVVSFQDHSASVGVNAFAHGGMNASDISFGDRSVSFGPKSVRSGDSVEIRMLFPAEWLPDAPVIDETIYETVLAEEARIAEEEQARAVRTENAKYIFTAVYILLFFSAWLLMTKKYGLKGRLAGTPDPSGVTRWPAAFLTAALEDEADTDALSGTLMELVSDGSILMEPEGEGLRFTLVRREAEGRFPHQTALIDWLFDRRDFFLLSELNAGTDYERARRFEDGYNRYVSQVSADLLASGLRFKNDGLRISLNALIIILGAMGTGGVLLAGTPNLFLGLTLGSMVFLLIFLMSRIRRLTDEGERLQANAEVFKRAGVSFEDGYSDYISCYAALGMTEPLVQSIEHSAIEPSADDMPVWMFTGWYYSLHTLNSSMRDFHHHNASIPDPNASSSSRSGGSTGNGGGGGHGAW